MESNRVFVGDCLDVLRALPDQCVDLVLGSPPYEDARTYGIGFRLRGQDWVDWMVERWREMQRVSRGAVVMVVEGKTSKFRWSATPALLMADLHRAGLWLRKPPAFHRVGIPGSGGPDWFRNDYEFCVVTSRGKLPWADPTACGHPPKYEPGGALSNRDNDGRRKNRGMSVRGKSRYGKIAQMNAEGMEPKVAAFTHEVAAKGAKLHTKRTGDSMRVQCYTPPSKANPGNVIHCKVGGGLMGSQLAHENEAPFPESLAERFVLSFVPPGGIVLDPFCGSGTTAAVAEKHGRRWLGIDVRPSQVDLTQRRIKEVRGTEVEAGG